jgi:hypothetical protein
VLEVGLAIFVFLLWVILQRYLWGASCTSYLGALVGKDTGYIEDLYYNMDDHKY